MEPCFECVGEGQQWRSNSLVSKSTLSKWKPVKVREQLVYFVWAAFYTGWSRTVYRLIKCVLLPFKDIQNFALQGQYLCLQMFCYPSEQDFRNSAGGGGDSSYSTFIPAPSGSRCILHTVPHLSLPTTT